MAYIGRGLDKISNVEKLDNLTFDGSSTSYSLLKGGVSFTPSSANNILLSIDGVVQAGNFTVSGSTIDFGTAVSASSTCDFILHYGVGLITTPADGTVTGAKIASSAVDLTSKVTGTLPVANGGTNLTSGFANGITMSDFWILNDDVTISGSNVLLNTANLVQSSVTTSGFIGTGMSYSSGYFTFPSTGIYQITVVYDITTTTGQDVSLKIWTTTDNSTYNQRTAAYQYCPANQLISGVSNFVFDVTNTTTHKLGLYYYAVGGGTTTLRGSSTQAETQVTFLRLGDT